MSTFPFNGLRGFPTKCVPSSWGGDPHVRTSPLGGHGPSSTHPTVPHARPSSPKTWTSLALNPHPHPSLARPLNPPLTHPFHPRLGSRPGSARALVDPTQDFTTKPNQVSCRKILGGTRNFLVSQFDSVRLPDSHHTTSETFTGPSPAPQTGETGTQTGAPTAVPRVKVRAVSRPYTRGVSRGKIPTSVLLTPTPVSSGLPSLSTSKSPVERSFVPFPIGSAPCPGLGGRDTHGES